MNKILLVSLAFLCFLTRIALAAPPQGTITGTLKMKEGQAVAGAGVMFFDITVGPPPSPDRYWRVPDAKTGTDSNGKFTVNLTEGRYYMGVIKHASGKWFGPPEEGEVFLPSPDAQGVFKQYTVKSGEITDIGIVAEVVTFRRAEHGSKGPVTAVEGIITDETGNPVENAVVFAIADTKPSARPIFVSDKTGKDGKFTLKMDKGGTFFLKARSVYGGGKPKTQEILGLYGKKGAPTPVKVETGKTTKGIVISGIRYAERNPQLRQK